MGSEKLHDQILDDVWKARESYSARFKHDLKAIVKDLQRKERSSPGRLVSLPPKGARDTSGSPRARVSSRSRAEVSQS